MLAALVLSQVPIIRSSSSMKPRILFVDDHEDTRLLLEAWLAAHGYSVRTAASLSEGLRLAQAEEFDLYLLDYLFSAGTGKELCQRIREFDAKTPILFFSASNPRLQEEALKCGAQGFVLKPHLEELAVKINQTLRADA
jgi:CheY-like chemotaxis protein